MQNYSKSTNQTVKKILLRYAPNFIFNLKATFFSTRKNITLMFIYLFSNSIVIKSYYNFKNEENIYFLKNNHNYQDVLIKEVNRV